MQKPIICFDDISTLKKNLIELNKEKIAELVDESDFITGTSCLNITFSRQLEKWGLKWSYSTAFYPGAKKIKYKFENEKIILLKYCKKNNIFKENQNFRKFLENV